MKVLYIISPAHMKARALRAIWRQHKTSAHRRHAPFDRPSVWRKIFAYFVFLHDSSGVYANNEKLSELLDFCRRFCDRAGWRLRALVSDGSNYSKKSSTKPSSTWTWHSVKKTWHFNRQTQYLYYAYTWPSFGLIAISNSIKYNTWYNTQTHLITCNKLIHKVLCILVPDILLTL